MIFIGRSKKQESADGPQLPKLQHRFNPGLLEPRCSARPNGPEVVEGIRNLCLYLGASRFWLQITGGS